MKTPVYSVAVGLAVFCLTGCANYRYHIAAPAEAAQSIAEEGTTVVNYAPLRYRFAEHNNRLAMAIENPTDNAVELTERSYLVTPFGETRALPLGRAVIGPRSHIGMILPPEVQRLRENPSFGFGFGFGYHRSYDPFFHPGFGFYSPLHYERPYYLDEVPIWNWEEGEVRMRLHYQQEPGTNTFEHHFTFDRRKVKN